MPRIYTEFRINHETQEEKEVYELYFDESLRELGYKSRAEWLREMIRDTNNEATVKMSARTKINSIHKAIEESQK